MATSMGAWACGVDLIIPDKTQPASKEKPHFTCIELNFNPAMYIHTYCAEGPGQAITPKILDKLFNESKKFLWFLILKVKKQELIEIIVVFQVF